MVLSAITSDPSSVLSFLNIRYYITPFRHWEIDQLFDMLPLLQMNLDTSTTNWEAYYDNDCERDKRTARPPLPQGYNTLLTHLNSKELVSWLGRLTSIPLVADPNWYGGGLHSTSPGGWLNCHLDYALHPETKLERRINLIWFANEEWKEEWGGGLEFYDETARKVVKRIYPKFNRAVLWEAGDLSYHGVEKVSSASPQSRNTLACYYLAQPREGCVRQRALYIPNRGERRIPHAP